MAQFIIEEEFVNELLNYLGTRPFVEVFGLMKKFEKLTPVKTEEPTEEAEQKSEE